MEENVRLHSSVMRGNMGKGQRRTNPKFAVELLSQQCLHVLSRDRVWVH